MHAPRSECRKNTHTRSYSTPNVTDSPRKRRCSTSVPHHLLSSNSHHLNLVAPAVVDLTRLNSPSLASFTPYSESIDSQGPARGSLRAHMHFRSQSLSSIPMDTKGLGMPAPSERLQLPSHFKADSTDAYQAGTLSAESPRSSSPPSSPSISIPSISRTHSTTASSSLPGTPPLPLTPLSQRRHSKFPSKKKMYRETIPGAGGRKRAPSLPMCPADRRRDSSCSRERVRERTLSAFGGNTTARLDRITTTRSRSPPCVSMTPRSNSPSSPRSLAALESSSKLMQASITCAICGVSGPDFPRCPRCGDAWCSRACRMAARNKAGSDGDGVRGHGCRGSPRRTGVRLINQSGQNPASKN